MTDPATTIAEDRNAPNIAVDIQPDYTRGTFTWDVSDWDGPDLLAWGNGSDDWQNVVCDVTDVATRRGLTRAGGVLTVAEEGTARIVLRDTERRFDPTVNGDSIHPGTPVRIRAWGVMNGFEDTLDGGTPEGEFTGTVSGGTPTAPGAGADGGTPVAESYWSEVLFTGRIGSGAEGIQVSYSKTGAPVVTILAVDRVTPLSSWKATGRAEPGVGGGDDLLERLNRVLAELSWPATTVAEDVDTTFASTLASSTLSRAWELLDDCTTAELGRLWIDRNDRIVVRSRGSELSGPVRGTLSDVHDEIVAGAVHCCYDDADVVFGTELLTNRSIAGRRVPRVDGAPDAPVVIAQVDDGESQARYDVVAIERRDLELETDEQLVPWAQTMVLDSTEPELRVNSVSVAPRNAPEAWPSVAATDIGDRWSFRLNPEIGPTVARTLGVLGIAHDITPQSWDCTWVTETAPTPGDNNPSGWFTFDLSEWDGDDILAPLGGVVITA